MAKKNNAVLPLYRNFERIDKVHSAMGYLNILNAHQTRRTESEYHIVLAYSTLVAGIFVFVTVTEKVVGRNGIRLPIWIYIGLSIFLVTLGILNIVKICHSHRIYEELGKEIVRVEEKVFGFHEDGIYIECRPLCGFTEKKLGQGPGYKYNVWVIALAGALALFVLWGVYVL